MSRSRPAPVPTAHRAAPEEEARRPSRRPLRLLGALAVANGFAYASAWNYEGGTSALLACRTASFQDPAAWRKDPAGWAGNYGSAAYGAPVVSGGRLYVSATTLVDGQPVALHDQFTLGAAAPGVIR